MNPSVMERLAERLGATSDGPWHLELQRHGVTLRVQQLTDRIQLEATLEEPLSHEVSLRELREADYYDFFGDPELTFDDPEFDERILVRGNAIWTRRLLTQELRGALVELHQCSSSLSLNRLRLRAEWLTGVPSVDAALALVEAALAVTTQLRPPRRPRGAYR